MDKYHVIMVPKDSIAIGTQYGDNILKEGTEYRMMATTDTVYEAIAFKEKLRNSDKQSSLVMSDKLLRHLEDTMNIQRIQLITY